MTRLSIVIPTYQRPEWLAQRVTAPGAYTAAAAEVSAMNGVRR